MNAPKKKPSGIFQFGQVKVVPVKVGEFAVDMLAWGLLSSAEEGPRLGELASQTVPVFGFLVQLAGRTVVIDAGRFELETGSSLRIPGYEPPDGMVAQLRQMGIDPEVVSDVVITHVHFDHINDLAGSSADASVSFPNARHYLGRADLDELDDAGQKIIGLLAEHNLLTLVDGDLAIGQHLQLMAAPGETGGHQILRVETEGGERLYFVGDLYHHPIELRDGWRQVPWADPVANQESRHRLTADAMPGPSFLLASHIPHIYRLSNEVWTPTHSLFQ